jgi:hypothetical protein
MSARFGFDWEERCDGDAKNAFRHYGHELLDLEVVTFDEFR